MDLFFLLLTAIAIGVAAGSSRLDAIDLPKGFFPEGITLAEGWEVYVGSLLEGERSGRILCKNDLSLEVTLHEKGNDLQISNVCVSRSLISHLASR